MKQTELTFNPLYAWIVAIFSLSICSWLVIESVSAMIRKYVGEKEHLKVEEVVFIILLGSVATFLVAADLINLDVDYESINMQFVHYFIRIMTINTSMFYIYASVFGYFAENILKGSDAERAPLLLVGSINIKYII
jgi:hypothetical protein